MKPRKRIPTWATYLFLIFYTIAYYAISRHFAKGFGAQYKQGMHLFFGFFGVSMIMITLIIAVINGEYKKSSEKKTSADESL
jgi:hypothetical protein